MKRRAFVRSAVAAFLAGRPASARPPFVLHEAPRLLLSPRFQNEHSRTVRLDEFAGRILLLNIWATWCPPCREEMPALDRLQARLGGREFEVIPLSVDAGGIDAVRPFYDAIGIRHLSLCFGEDLSVRFALAVFGLPTSILIDRSGRERGRVIGPANWDGEEATAQITWLMAET